jgi:sigma-E factor negative regulatory protein RseC
MVKFKTVEEIGFVRSVEGATATVSVPKKSGCEGCSLGVCKPEEQFMQIEALNPVKARAGQKVRIVMKSYTYLQGSIIIYGIPALSLIAGAIIGKEIFSPYLKGYDPDVVSAVFGLGAFAVTFLLIKLWSGKASKKADLRPVIEEILSDETG